jgi:hypothetical protein
MNINELEKLKELLYSKIDKVDYQENSPYLIIDAIEETFKEASKIAEKNKIYLVASDGGSVGKSHALAEKLAKINGEIIIIDDLPIKTGMPEIKIENLELIDYKVKDYSIAKSPNRRNKKWESPNKYHK